MNRERLLKNRVVDDNMDITSDAITIQQSIYKNLVFITFPEEEKLSSYQVVS